LNLIDTQVTSIFVRSFDLCGLRRALWLWMLRKVYKHKQFQFIFGARKRLGNYSGFE
jgi:hypothetical protein